MAAIQNKNIIIDDDSSRRASVMRLLENEMATIFSAETRNTARQFRYIERSLERRGRALCGRSAAQY
jgi:hypothetical protein